MRKIWFPFGRARRPNELHEGKLSTQFRSGFSVGSEKRHEEHFTADPQDGKMGTVKGGHALFGPEILQNPSRTVGRSVQPISATARSDGNARCDEVGERHGVRIVFLRFLEHQGKMVVGAGPNDAQGKFERRFFEFGPVRGAHEESSPVKMHRAAIYDTQSLDRLLLGDQRLPSSALSARISAASPHQRTLRAAGASAWGKASFRTGRTRFRMRLR